MRRPVVEDRTGLSRSTIYAMIKAEAFPRPIQLGKRAVGWSEEAITAWIEERENASK
ncbi:helix-turn-helix transcriptional regulator [Sulfitobacter sp. JB4-11]|uniref:helix-turn-helix transcriptional regulator n=1 Tax=Sulfitobacter rhodophyticola TaxID=3238304 RepID=UPI003D81BE56